ncbi:hypothetical protein DSECCO2_598900 [anaerobic digester metagenome]
MQPVDKLTDQLVCYAGIRACKFFQGFIRFRIAFASENGLYGFGNNSPVAFKIGGDLFFVEQQFPQTFGN